MDRKIITGRILLVSFFIILAGLQVLILNRYSTNGEKLTFLLNQIDEAEAENSRLTQQIASSSAMITISTKAEILGFNSPSSTFSLSSPLTVAKFFDFSL